VRRGRPATQFFAELTLEPAFLSSDSFLSSLQSNDDKASSPETNMEFRPRRKMLLLAVDVELK